MFIIFAIARHTLTHKYVWSRYCALHFWHFHTVGLPSPSPQSYVNAAGARVEQSVSALPSLAFSAALAAFHAADCASEVACAPVAVDVDTMLCGTSSATTTGTATTTATAMATATTPADRASLLLQRALLLFPEVLEPLVEACSSTASSAFSSSSSASSGRWAPILCHDFFADASRRRQRTAALEKLIRIYVEKNSVLWKAPQVMDWLHTHAQVGL